MRRLLASVLLAPVIYFACAISLVLLPFDRIQTEDGLNFEAVAGHDFSSSEAQERYFTARDNSRLFYRQFEGGSDVTVVLLHGSGSEGRYLIPLADRLNRESDITVVIPDLRGHGLSQNEMPGDVGYLGQLEHDLEDLLEELRAAAPGATIVLGGHSSGGGLAVKYGGNHSGSVDGLILLAPYLGYQAPTVRPNSGGWVQVAQLRYVGLAMLNNIGIRFLNDKPVLFFNRPADLSAELQLVSYSYRMNESLSPQSYETDLAGYKNPVLLLVGEMDEAFYPAAYQGVLNRHAPHAQFHILGNVQHLELPLNEQAATLIGSWIVMSYGE